MEPRQLERLQRRQSLQAQLDRRPIDSRPIIALVALALAILVSVLQSH